MNARQFINALNHWLGLSGFGGSQNRFPSIFFREPDKAAERIIL